MFELHLCDQSPCYVTATSRPRRDVRAEECLTLTTLPDAPLVCFAGMSDGSLLCFRVRSDVQVHWREDYGKHV